MKRVLALLMSGIMALTLLSGCQSGKSKTSSKSTSGKNVQLTWLMGYSGTVPSNADAVEAKANQLTQAAIGVTVKIKYLTADQMKLILNSGESYDMVFTCSWFNNYADQANKGLYADISSKIKTVTPNLYKFIPPNIWKGSEVNGKLYAIPVYKDSSTSLCWMFNKKVVSDELKLDYTKYTTFDSIEPLLAAYKKAHPDKYPIMVSSGGIRTLDYQYEMLNNAMHIGINYEKKDNKVVSTYNESDYMKTLETVHSWFQKGYINPDAPTLSSYPNNFIVMNQAGYSGTNSEWSSTYGFDVVSTKYAGPYLTTASIRGAMNAVSKASAHVDDALKYMEYINLNTKVRDILAYGIEGTNFEYTNNGKQVKILNQSYQPWTWAQASIFNLTPIEPNTSHDLDGLKKLNEESSASANKSTIGFSFDSTKVQSQVAACTTIFNKYVAGLNTGSTDPDVQVPKMMAELKGAGYNDIISECQSQLDSYVKSNK